MNFLDILLPILTIFIFILIGFILRKSNSLNDESSKTLSNIAVKVCLPAIIIKTYYNNLSINNVTENLEFVLWGTIIVASLYALSFILSKLFTKDDYEKKVYRYTFTISNYGGIGYPLVTAFFGEVGLFHYMMVTLPISLFAYTEGYRILTDSKKIGLKFLLSAPIIGMIAGVILGFSGVELPSFFTGIINTLADMFGPLSMIIAGIAIASYPLKQVFLNKKAYVVAILKMIVLPLIVMGIMLLAGASKDVIIYATTFVMLPLGMNTIVFPRMLGKDCSLGAQTVSAGTLLSLITLPTFIWLFTLI